VIQILKIKKMKKIILSAVAVMAFGFTNAQSAKFGVKAGLNISNLTGDVSNNSSKTGIALGASVEFKVSDKFAIQPELVYSVLGAKDNSINENLNLDYLTIPVVAKYYVADKFSLEAGPQIGFLLSAKAGSTDVKSAVNSTDFGLNFGAGYDFTKNLSAGVRYTAGLSNIAKDSGSDKVHNSNFAIALGYKF
jgi:opacity protein-like surface antigen